MAVVDSKDIGDNVYIWEWTKVREGASVGDDVSIGQGCYIDKNVVIGDGCRIQNGVSIYDGVMLGKDVFIGPNVTFTNDLYPRAGAEFEIVPTVLCDGVSVGAGCVILCGVVIGEGAMIGAGATVVRNVGANVTMIPGCNAHRSLRPV